MQKPIKQYFRFTWRGLIITVAVLLAITLLSLALSRFEGSDKYAPMLFIFAVFLISRFTEGYLFGMVSSVIGVILVNYIFTYPYFAFNFTIPGYPITMLCLLCTSAMTSTMTTRIKNQEELRIEAAKEKMRGNLLRAVSHDLRTPLTSIVGTTSALLENGERISPEQQRELLKESHDDAEWLVHMVENLLSVTRISGETRITKQPEAAEEVIGEVIRTFKKRFPEVTIAVSVPDELLMIPMDATLIEQVLINLLENAVLHSGNMNGISLTVESVDDRAIFKVSDNGIGIHDTVFKHLFDGYFTGSDSPNDNVSRNMGIGLSVCQSIIKAHGGQMDAYNKAGGGAVFRFMLPLDGGK